MFKNLTEREKIVIIVSAIVLVTGLFYFQYLGPKLMEKMALEEEVNTQRTQYNQMMQLIKRKLPTVKKSTEELQIQYQQLITQFPNQKEISIFLLEIERLANEQAINLEYFSPRNLESRGDFYLLPINISFYASYQAIVSFFNALEKSQKRMDIAGFDLKTLPTNAEGILQADMTLNIYILREDEEIAGTKVNE